MIAQIGIPSANARSVSDMATPLPDMSGTVMSYFRPLILIRVTKKVQDFETKEVRQEWRCQGTIQPFGPRELRLKPEGQRAWDWQLLHTTPDVFLEDDEEFTIKGTRYRVMSRKGFSEYGYVSYELVQDYK